jgi:tetratricopeptide (TPR) repeat protein
MFKRRFMESYIAETEIEPPRTDMERERLGDIYALLENGKLDQAARMVQRYRGEASSAVFDYLMGNIHQDRKEIDQAARAYQVAIKKYPKFRRAYRNLALIHVRTDEHDKAIAALTRVIELGGGDAIVYGLLGLAYTGRQQFISAESAFRMAILMDPKTVDWKKGLAGAFFRQQRYAEAVSICDRMLQDDPDSVHVWTLQANAYVGMGKPLRAAENYEFIDRLGASTVDSLSMLGDIYINEKLFEMAADSYGRALQMDLTKGKQDDPNALEKVRDKLDKNTGRAIRAARVMAANGALDSTETMVNHVRKHREEFLDKDDRKQLLRLEARIAVSRGADHKQAEILEEIVALDPMDGRALMLLGQYYANAPEGRRDLSKAIFYYERAEKIEKFEADAKVQHAQLLVRDEKYAEAIPLLKSAQSTKYRDSVQKYLKQVERLANKR